MPQRWQMRMAGALSVGIDVSSCSWCFVKLGSSVEIASPVVVNENGDSRVSRKWERLALRGSIVVLFGFVLVGAVFAPQFQSCSSPLEYTLDAGLRVDVLGHRARTFSSEELRFLRR